MIGTYPHTKTGTESSVAACIHQTNTKRGEAAYNTHRPKPVPPSRIHIHIQGLEPGRVGVSGGGHRQLEQRRTESAGEMRERMREEGKSEERM
eukprot:296454-Rhodomonas_salina.1